jgi:hypothetical protein
LQKKAKVMMWNLYDHWFNPNYLFKDLFRHAKLASDG